jgi:hypothetical protein
MMRRAKARLRRPMSKNKPSQVANVTSNAESDH